MKLHGITENDDLSSEKLSKFYKMFLDKNQKVHFLYNISWYIKNFSMLTLHIKSVIYNKLKKLKKN